MTLYGNNGSQQMKFTHHRSCSVGVRRWVCFHFTCHSWYTGLVHLFFFRKNIYNFLCKKYQRKKIVTKFESVIGVIIYIYMLKFNSLLLWHVYISPNTLARHVSPYIILMKCYILVDLPSSVPTLWLQTCVVVSRILLLLQWWHFPVSSWKL